MTDSKIVLSEAAAGRSEDDLLADLGLVLAGGPDASRDGSLEEFRDRAENWIDRHRQALKERLCKPDRDKYETAALEISAVADAISGLLNGPAIYTLAAILVKRGLDQLCK